MASELSRWAARAACIEDPELRQDALSSLREKRFHCLGGSVYALLSDPESLRFIVAYETLIDYLDNLVDGPGKGAYRDARALHRAVTDAVRGVVRPDYYRHHGRQEHDYLFALVEACREACSLLPAPAAFRNLAHPFAARYAELQVLKHLPRRRAEALERLARRCPEPDLYPNEWLAGTGSSLAVLALYASAYRGAPELPPAVHHLQALHILLDYLIDRRDDAQAGAWNFVLAYGSPEAAAERLATLAQAAWSAAAATKDGAVHRFVLLGLHALYLSDPKVADDPWADAARRALARALGPEAEELRELAGALRDVLLTPW